jgi:hypothetical protein
MNSSLHISAIAGWPIGACGKLLAFEEVTIYKIIYSGLIPVQ